jgi:thiol-disulfide isomerase/thioredoxin
VTRISVPVRTPEFPGDVTWLQGGPLRMQELRGRPVLIDFWDYTCVNCLHTIPYLKEWNVRYSPYGLVIIGVHSPEFAFARERGYVARAVGDLGIEYPVLLDNSYSLWDAYANRYWPAKYLIDKDGYLRAYHFGEGAYEEVEGLLQSLIREVSPEAKLPPVMPAMREEDKPGAVCYRGTTDLYLGYSRGRIGNADVWPDKPARYREELTERDGYAYLAGEWLLGKESLTRPEGVEGESRLFLRYSAKEVNLVAYPPRQPGKLELLQDGHPLAPEDAGEDVTFEDARSVVIVDQPRMFMLVNNREFDTHDLSISTASDGMGLYAFTFVTCVAENTETGRAQAG